MNRGGVVLKKEFLGFETLHRNSDSLMAWYRKAYPQEFGVAEASPASEENAVPSAEEENKN